MDPTMSDTEFAGNIADNESAASSSFVGTPVDGTFGSISATKAGKASRHHRASRPRYRAVADPEIASVVEDVEDYCPGGFCPVELGSNMCGNFEIIHKLGHGRHATVWLAWDFVKNQWKALKVFKADSSEQAMAAFEKLLGTRLKPGDTQDAHIQIPEEALWLDSANGRHVCYVLGLLGPSVVAPTCRKKDQVQQTILLQLVAAVHFLHNRRLRHGDIKPENVLLHPWHVAGNTKEDMIKQLGEPVTYEVEPAGKGSKILTDLQAPKYLVAPTRNLGRLARVVRIMVTDIGLAATLDTGAQKDGLSTATNAAANGGARSNSDVWGLVFMLARMKCSELDSFETAATGSEDNSDLEHHEQRVRDLLDSWYDLFANLHLDPEASGEEDQDIIDIVEETKVSGKKNQLVVDALESELPQDQLDSLVHLLKARKFGLLKGPASNKPEKAPAEPAAGVSQQGDESPSQKARVRTPKEKKNEPAQGSPGEAKPAVAKDKEPLKPVKEEGNEKPSSPKKPENKLQKSGNKQSAEPRKPVPLKPTISPEPKPRGRSPRRRSPPPPLRPQRIIAPEQRTPSTSPPRAPSPSPASESSRPRRRRQPQPEQRRTATPPRAHTPETQQDTSGPPTPPRNPRSLGGILDTITRPFLNLISWTGLTTSPGNLVFLGFTAATAVFTVVFAIWLFTIGPPVPRGSVPATGTAKRGGGANSLCEPGHMYVQTRRLSAHSFYFEGIMTFPDNDNNKRADGLECPVLEDVQFDAQIETFPDGRSGDDISWDLGGSD